MPSKTHIQSNHSRNEATPAQGILPDQTFSLETLWTRDPEIIAAKDDGSGSSISLAMWASPISLCHPALKVLSCKPSNSKQQRASRTQAQPERLLFLNAHMALLKQRAAETYFSPRSWQSLNQRKRTNCHVILPHSIQRACLTAGQAHVPSN